jgi:thioredoxin-like negative regulator of GroEL
MNNLISEEDLYTGKEFQVIYFYASWMPWFKKINNMISSFEEKNKNFYFLAVDVDKYKPLINRFNITSVPTFIAFYKDKEVKRCSGIIMSSAFKSFLNDIYNKQKEKSNVKSS